MNGNRCKYDDFFISDANSLKGARKQMFYDFCIVAGACGSQRQALAIVCETFVFCCFFGQLTLFIHLLEFHLYLHWFSLLLISSNENHCKYNVFIDL